MLKNTLIATQKLVNRNYSTVPTHKLRESLKISAWQIHSYGDTDQVQLTTTRAPVIKHPNEVLVKVDAASLNPIDLYMTGGYGRTLIGLVRNYDEFPVTLGRDFCGTVVSKGHEVGSRFTIGDKVYGFQPIGQQGTLAELITVTDNFICPKPSHLSDIESASLVYASMTAWSALYVTGNLLFKDTAGLRVLILGASGGVGTLAVQLLKSQGCIVYATCSEDAVGLVSSLGADHVFNYKDEKSNDEIASESRYHIVLDCAKIGSENLPKKWSYDTYITLNSPLLVNTDKYGLIPGLWTSLNDLLRANCKDFGRKYVKWGFAMPSETGLNFLHGLISKGKIKPVIHHAFKFSEVREALGTLSRGHLRGKLVIDFN